MPIGHERNELRQLAVGLLRLEKKGLQATVQGRINAIMTMKDLRN